MSRCVWDQVGDRRYETGIDRVVLYLQNSNGAYPSGVPWSGVTSLTESPSGAESTALYADNIKYLNLISNEEIGASIEAYSSPVEFDQCDGTLTLGGINGVLVGQQTRKSFGLCYRTVAGNDTNGNDAGYKLHLLYGCKAAPSEKAFSTVNDSPEAMTLSWEISTTPVDVAGMKPTASITIDSTKVNATKLAALEDILYGTAGTDPRLPLPAEVLSTLTGGAATVYGVQNYLVGCTTSNAATTAVVSEGYEETLTLASGMASITVIVTMGGTDITSTAWNSSTKKVNIAANSITGPIVVYAVAKA